MSSKPDTIKVTASHREEISATHADLHMTVKGSSLVGGDEALKKAKEVNQLVEELTRFGLPMSDIHLQSVYTEAASGAFIKSSSATYRLRIRCNKLEQFPDLLGIIASQKNAAFERVEWKYPDDLAQNAALEKALAKAREKANTLSRNLGVELLGIYNFTENTTDYEGPVPQTFMAAQAKGPARSVGIVPQAELGMDIQHSKMLEVHVEVEYRVSAFD